MLEWDVKQQRDKQQTKYGPYHIYTVHVMTDNAPRLQDL